MITPQQGFQMKFLKSPAQIVIGGGSAGGGKTYALLLESIRNSSNKNYGGVIFRRTSPQIRNEGGLWDNSSTLFRKLPDPPKSSEYRLTWQFPAGGKLKFSHLQLENTKYSWQGAQVPFIGFDELTHFTETQFFYLLSRNRSPYGIPSCIRATCNPDSGSWVKKFISWWIYPDDYHIETLQGMPIPERDGIVRYFIRDNNEYIWGDTRQEVIAKAPHIFRQKKFLESLIEARVSPEQMVKSATFVFGDVYGNRELLKSDPNYLANLMTQDKVEKNRLLKGSWKHVDDEYRLYEYAAIKDFFSSDYIRGGKRYITADIALQGSDLFVVGVWDGLRLIDVTAIEKSDSDLILATIKQKAREFSVPQSRICYDHDGVGGFLKGFLKNSKPFVNGSKPLKENPRDNKEPNYKNLRTQCYYKLAEYINSRKMYCSDRRYKDLIQQELEAIRKKPYDGTGKLEIISKAEIKLTLGRSPDFADMLMMRMYFELAPKTTSRVKTF